MKKPKLRAELFAKANSLPKPQDIDYADDVSEADYEAMKRANADVPQEGGILISGEEW